MAATVGDSGRYALALPPGALLLGRYRIVRVLAGASPAAITYLANDEEAKQETVIKEFLPRAFVGRARDGVTLRAHSPTDSEGFHRGLRRFIREAELLTDLVHPNLPRVRAYFVTNGTAYLVADHYPGTTLTAFATGSNGRLPCDVATSLISGILDALQTIHGEGLVHGYVTPDNIWVTPERKALLLGLGTTWHVAGQAKKPATGYAPIEEYASRELGPWTDVYASAAVLYRLVTGVPPLSAFERAAGQMLRLPPYASDVPIGMSRVMLNALTMLPDGRPHSAEEFRRRLESSTYEQQVPVPTTSELRDTAVATTTPGDDWAPAPNPTEGTPLMVPAADDFAYPEPGLLQSLRMRLARLIHPTVVIGIAGAVLLGLAMASTSIRSDEYAAAQRPAATQSRPAPPPDPVVQAGLAWPAPAAPPARAFDRPADASTARQDSTPPPPPVEATVERTPPPDDHPSRRTIAAPAEPRRPSAASRAEPRLRLGSVPRFSMRTLPRLPTEALPIDLAARVRQQLAQGAERMQAGDHANAHRAYAAALRQTAVLARRHPHAADLAALRRDAERALAQVAQACRTENQVAWARGRPLAPCQ